VDGGVSGGVNGATAIGGLTNNVQDTAESRGTDRDSDGGTSVTNLLATLETIGGFHGNGTDSVVTDLSGNFKDKADVVALNFKGVQDVRNAATFKIDVDDGTYHLDNLTIASVGGFAVFVF